MSLKKWAWDIFEATGNLEAYLAVKEVETQEKTKVIGKMEFGDIEIDNSHLSNVNKLNETQINGDINGANKN